MTPRQNAKTGKERAAFRTMMHERPDHRVEIVCKTSVIRVHESAPSEFIEQSRPDRQTIDPACVPALRRTSSLIAPLLCIFTNSDTKRLE
jgi:hypothetical protein